MDSYSPSKIMVIDDDEDFINVIEIAANHKDITISHAKTAIDAIRKVNKFKPDLILLDVFLGNESGFKVCKDLKKITDAKIVMISGSFPNNFEDLASLYGSDGFMQKPFSFGQVEEFLNNSVESVH